MCARPWAPGVDESCGNCLPRAFCSPAQAALRVLWSRMPARGCCWRWRFQERKTFPSMPALPQPCLAFACGLSLLTGCSSEWRRRGSHQERRLPMLCGAGCARSQAAPRCCNGRSWWCRRDCRSYCWSGAGLFAESLGKLEHIDLKLDPVNRYIVHINPQTAGYSQRQVGELYRTIEERFHALPGVEKVGISSFTPMEDNNNGWGVQIQGKPDQHVVATFIKANAEYFDSVGTRVIAGRGLRARRYAGVAHGRGREQGIRASTVQAGREPHRTALRRR